MIMTNTNRFRVSGTQEGQRPAVGTGSAKQPMTGGIADADIGDGLAQERLFAELRFEMKEIVGREGIDVACDVGQAGAEVTVGSGLNAVVQRNPDGHANEGKGEGEHRGIGGGEAEANAMSARVNHGGCTRNRVRYE